MNFANHLDKKMTFNFGVRNKCDPSDMLEMTFIKASR